MKTSLYLASGECFRFKIWKTPSEFWEFYNRVISEGTPFMQHVKGQSNNRAWINAINFLHIETITFENIDLANESYEINQFFTDGESDDQIEMTGNMTLSLNRVREPLIDPNEDLIDFDEDVTNEIATTVVATRENKSEQTGVPRKPISRMGLNKIR